MGSVAYFFAIVVMFAVAVLLVRGLFSLARDEGGHRSNKLMQIRVILQAAAIALIMLTLWLTGGGRPS